MLIISSLPLLLLATFQILISLMSASPSSPTRGPSQSHVEPLDNAESAVKPVAAKSNTLPMDVSPSTETHSTEESSIPPGKSDSGLHAEENSESEPGPATTPQRSQETSNSTEALKSDTIPAGAHELPETGPTHNATRFPREFVIRHHSGVLNRMDWDAEGDPQHTFPVLAPLSGIPELSGGSVGILVDLDKQNSD
ncbi:hypothetical protein C8R43DRAFT_943889 [Mycena crocata]|nr:hypothetical protein C8R43DRAFT_943889 [Mycena crocata]